MAPTVCSGVPQCVGVLALQGDFREHVELLRSLGADAFEVRGPAELARAEALVLPGGESTTISLLLESSGLLEPLGERLAEGMPALGTCAGMILLASEVLDGRPDQHCFGAIDISVRRNAFGRQRESFEADLEVSGLEMPGLEMPGLEVPGLEVPGLEVSRLSAPLHAVFVRAPVVERIGPEVEVLATVTMDGGTKRPVVCRQGPVLVSAFHPELARDPRLHELFLRAGVFSPQRSMTRKDDVRAL